MKTYVLTLSKFFPYNDVRKGERTLFEKAIKEWQVFKGESFYPYPKIHTIRSNYELWHERFQEIEKGNAQLSIRQWSGIPYRSKQEIICNLTKADGIGLQKLEVRGFLITQPMYVDGRCIDSRDLARNDGLSELDWMNWFNEYDLQQPLAVIHFTDFRY